MLTTKKSKDLGKLEVKKSIRVLMLPSDAKTVIVNYSSPPKMRVTCTVSEKKREVQIGRGYKSKIKIKTPATLMSMVFYELPRVCGSDIENFYIHGYYTKDKKTLWASPYVLSNVYRNGAICFGAHNPGDLRSAYNLFWSAPFNYELSDVGYDLAYELNEDEAYDVELRDIDIEPDDTENYIKNYKKVLFDQQTWEDYTSVILGKKTWSSNARDAVLLTGEKSLLKQIPEKYWLKHGNQVFLAAGGKKHKNVWVFDTGKIKFKIPVDQVASKNQGY